MLAPKPNPRKSVEDKPAAPAGLNPELGVKQEDVTKGETEEAAEATVLEAAAKEVKTEAAALGVLEVSELFSLNKELFCLKSEGSVEATLVEFPLPPRPRLLPVDPPAFCRGGGGTP